MLNLVIFIILKHKFDKYGVIFIENDGIKSRLVSFQREDILMIIEFIFGILISNPVTYRYSWSQK